MVDEKSGSYTESEAGSSIDGASCNETSQSERVVDACGLICPEPVMLLHNAVRDAEPGSLLKVVATDPSTTRDIPKFCSFLNHELIESDKQNDQFIFLIRKGGGIRSSTPRGAAASGKC